MYSFSQAQRRGCSEILESLNYSNLLELKDTVARKINVWSTEDLINVILKHSQSAEELLKRRKVLREEILKYLIKHGVTVSTSSDKQQLINKALVYWIMSEMNREPTAAKKDVQVLHQKQREELGQKLVENTESIVVKPQTTTSTTLRELRQVRQAEEQKEKEEKEKRQEEQLRRQEEIRTPPQDAMPMELNINVNILQYHPPSQQEASGVSGGEQMGKEFCEWFFQLLNSQNPSFGQKAEEWGPQHFWDDAILHFTYCIQELVEEQHQSSVTVSLRLLSLVKDEQLLFNPNISQSGLMCVTSPHGIVAIAVAGTIHRNCQCLGVFEQLIGLIRTPVYGNNWKIRYINLKVKAFNDQPVILQPSVSVQMTELQACINELSAFPK
ncbi:uncharacterized protein C3orf38 homolog isoform X2 [Hypanus sabinus]|uniref:uncharacterized protein C3orf38 homolog isoform X2 n=1 Tax=Hypanus sabinus TaxID=79690 RepID=UPI0028C44A04|nr:uncharacterized protein C3orf38 homolog isoform X2 [Hypanus sabinus]